MQVTPDTLLQTFVDRDATDLYLTVGSPPCLRIHQTIERCAMPALTEEDVCEVMRALVSEEVISEFESTLEYNTAISWRNVARMRINLFRQQQHSGIVLRRIRTDIPSIESLKLPPIYGKMIMEKRGLILVAGPTGSGKSTSLASMIDHRNSHGTGHVITVEDPVEFLHEHRNCIITQRDVGIDTYSFGIGLKNALRQSPDIIVIGEIRDRETMEHAIVFAETGHLCLATLHSNNSNQAIERVINFFPEEKHAQILLNLSLNLRAVLSQRLVHNVNNTRSLATEIMLNHGLIKSLIQEGRIKEIRELIEGGRGEGMQTFEQSLFDLYKQGLITEETAVAEADHPANMRLTIKQNAPRRSMLTPASDIIQNFDIQKKQF